MLGNYFKKFYNWQHKKVGLHEKLYDFSVDYYTIDISDTTDISDIVDINKYLKKKKQYCKKSGFIKQNFIIVRLLLDFGGSTAR